MMEEPPPPRKMRGQALIDASREDLDLYAAEELNERIEQLQAEIETAPGRTQLQNKDRPDAPRPTPCSNDSNLRRSSQAWLARASWHGGCSSPSSVT